MERRGRLRVRCHCPSSRGLGCPAARRPRLVSEDYYDYQVNRPHISVDETDRPQPDLARDTRFYIARVPLYPHDIVLVQGIEPNMKWQRQFVREYSASLLNSRSPWSSLSAPLFGHSAHAVRARHGDHLGPSSGGADLDLEPSTSTRARPRHRRRPAGCVRPLRHDVDLAVGSDSRTTSRSPHLPEGDAVARPSDRGHPRHACAARRPRRRGSRLGDRRRRTGGRGRGSGRLRQASSKRRATQRTCPRPAGEAIAREFERYLRRRGADDR